MHKFALAPRYMLSEAFAKRCRFGPIGFIDRGCVDTATIAGRPPGVAPAYVMHTLCMHALVLVPLPNRRFHGTWFSPYSRNEQEWDLRLKSSPRDHHLLSP